MARRKVMLPTWANTEDASKSIEMLNEAFEGLTQGELVINTEANNTLLTTLNENGIPVIFESSEMIDKRLDGFLESIHQHDNKDVLDKITSGRTDSWDKAESNAKTYTDQQIDFIVSGASEAFDTLKEVETWINNHSGETKNIIGDINNLYASAHTHSNKSLLDTYTQTDVNLADAVAKKHEHGNKDVLDSITSDNVTQWNNAEPNVITEISAITKDNSNVISVNGKKVTIDLTNIESTPGPKGDDGITPVFTAVTASVNNATGVPYVSVTSAKTDGEKYSIAFDFQNLKGEKGDRGTSITSIERTEGNGAAGTTDVYTITYSDGTTYTFNVYNGEDGINGNNGITPVFTAVTANVNNAIGTPQVSVVTAKTADEKYSMEFSFQNMKGEKGDKGDKGDDGTSVKILGTKHSYNELPLSNNANGDGYIIGENLYVWNGSTWVDVGQIKGPQGDPGTNAYISAVTASVGNTTGTPSVNVTTAGTPSNISFNLSFNGLKGSSGNDGIGIKSFVRTNGNGAAGSTDTYTITFTNGETSAITVYNGSDGKNGASGAAGTNGSTWYNGITEPSTGTGVDGDWYINTSDWNVYHKESNSWAIKGNIKGETGSFDDSALSSYALKSEIPDISGKVDKVDGKGLSTNDFTNDLKNKLNGIAAGAEVNVQSDWNATSGDALILNKPSLATVATSGNYNDLSNKPNIPDISGIQSKLDGIAAGAEVNVQPDWNETTTTSDAYIKNKPTLATVATSGSYNDLTNTPKIPSVDGFIKNISLATSTEKLYIVGSTSKAGTTTSLNTSTTEVYMQNGEVYAASDERLKDFSNNVEVDFNKLSEIPKVYYSWKDDEEKRQMIGTSAQKLKEIYPELVSENEDGKLAVSYEKLSIIALAAIDKLYKENEELKDRLKRIEEKLGL